MPRISKSIDTLNDHYDVVVIGSGYGGGIAASRLSRAGRQVCVLERGREFQPGEFPDNLPEASAEMQFQTKKGRIGNDTGLFDFHVNDDINVLVGCGLGGTSLINANVLRLFRNWGGNTHGPPPGRGQGHRGGSRWPGGSACGFESRPPVS